MRITAQVWPACAESQGTFREGRMKPIPDESRHHGAFGFVMSVHVGATATDEASRDHRLRGGAAPTTRNI
jgi:hypothetical protein